jgi:hypothetical protein
MAQKDMFAVLAHLFKGFHAVFAIAAFKFVLYTVVRHYSCVWCVCVCVCAEWMSRCVAPDIKKIGGRGTGLEGLVGPEEEAGDADEEEYKGVANK